MMCNDTKFNKEDMVACMREASYVEVAKAGLKIYVSAQGGCVMAKVAVWSVGRGRG